MCLTVPAKVIEVKDDVATVDVLGEKREVRIDLVKPKVGDYVIIQFGFVTEIVDKEVAESSLKAWKKLKV